MGIMISIFEKNGYPLINMKTIERLIRMGIERKERALYKGVGYEKYYDLHCKATDLGLDIAIVNGDNYREIVRQVEEKEKDISIQKPLRYRTNNDKKNISPTRTPSRKRSQSMTFRMTEEEKFLLDDLCQTTGKSRNDILLNGLKNIKFNELEEVDKLAEDIKRKTNDFDNLTSGFDVGENLERINETFINAINNILNEFTERIDAINVKVEQDVIQSKYSFYNEKAVRKLIFSEKKLRDSLNEMEKVIRKSYFGFDNEFSLMIKRTIILKGKVGVLNGMIIE